MYDLHDGKVLYLLTQHSLFNRKHYPFLLCKCQRGAGVKDPNHKCVMILDEEHCQWYNRSLRRWKNKEADENYKEGEHMDWMIKRMMVFLTLVSILLFYQESPLDLMSFI